MNWTSAAESIIRQGSPCLFRLVTGLYCPGCGGTRAVKAFLRGNLLLSFQYHPLIVYMAAVAVLQVGSFLLAKAAKNPRIYLGHIMGFLYGGIGVILVNWIVKNLLLTVWGIDLLPPWPY